MKSQQNRIESVTWTLAWSQQQGQVAPWTLVRTSRQSETDRRLGSWWCVGGWGKPSPWPTASTHFSSRRTRLSTSCSRSASSSRWSQVSSGGQPYNFIRKVTKICSHCFLPQKQKVKHCCCLCDEIYRQCFEIYWWIKLYESRNTFFNVGADVMSLDGRAYPYKTRVASQSKCSNTFVEQLTPIAH